MTGDRLSALIRLQAAVTLVVDTLRELGDGPEASAPALAELLEWAKLEAVYAMGEAQGRPVGS